MKGRAGSVTVVSKKDYPQIAQITQIDKEDRREGEDEEKASPALTLFSPLIGFSATLAGDEAGR